MSQADLIKRDYRTVRLACDCCDRDDHDGITHVALAAAEAEGWRDISQEQSYRQACKTYDNPADEPAGYSVLDWWTHLGTCPDCVAAGLH